MADEELWTIESWLFDTLASDATLANLIGGTTNPRISMETADLSMAYPFVEIRYISPIGGGDFNDLSHDLIYTRQRYLVVAHIDGRRKSPLRPIMKRLTQLLKGSNGSGDDGIVVYCKRETPWSQTVMKDGLYYTERGHFWEIAAR